MTTSSTVKPATSIDELIRSRRTIHDFRPEKPPQTLIQQAIDLARWAPNHLLTEPWHFYLLGKETAQAIARLNAEIISRKKGEQAGQAKWARWSAVPGWLVVTCENASDPLQSREDYAACCCAIQNLSLYLWSQNVGVKWTTGPVTRDPAFYDLIWVDPELETVVGLLWYGYPAEIPQTPRKPVSEILVELP
ncbi:MAG: nitroreductase [Candidatus Competibacteraceae bacterium]|nr:nitroreductase [Candidatus Competibacteraceae bacterium]